MKSNMVFSFIIVMTFLSCKEKSNVEVVAPVMTSTTPADGATRISLTSGVFVYLMTIFI